ncbi:MAG: HEPN domain-containing protein [Clostridiales bacterium]|jgi:HEPN domain-containing protein|nr:HEPN domain-containing protein [Clostridiales bacterium]
MDKVKYWLNLADEDMSVARLLMDGKKYLQAGFFCHLTAEKAIKAVISSKSDEIPPKIHDLKVLARQGGISGDLTEGQFSLLERLNPLQIEARYPEYKSEIVTTLSAGICQEIYDETEAFLCWIKQRLDK